MSTEGRRAMAVGLSEAALSQLANALATAGIALVGSAPDGPSGLRLLPSLRPDLVLVAAVMPGMDGLAFIERARRLRLDVVPDLLLFLPNGLRLPGGERLNALGAAAIAWPTDPSTLQGALSELRARGQSLPPAMAAQLEALLDELGVPEHPGRECLVRAVTLAWRDRRRLRCMKDNLYPELARQTGLTAAQAERAIRHAIDVAWRTGEIERQHRIFGDTIDARRGKPTCGEMIAQLAEELRWEGPQ